LLSIKEIGKNPSESKRKDMIRNNSFDTSILLDTIADLIERLVEYGCDTDIVVNTLKYYGFTKEQITEWYGLEHSGFETFNEAPYGK
jgi:hypothetical protein